MKARTWIIFLIIFISGIIIGVVGGRMAMHFRFKKMMKSGPEIIHKHLTEQLTQRLSLTEEQIPAVEEQLMKSVMEVDTIRKEAFARSKEIAEQTLQGLAPLLTPEQQEILRTISPEDLRPRGLPPPPPPPPPPPRINDNHSDKNGPTS